MTCNCIERVDGLLAASNTRLKLPMMFGDDQTERVVIVTEQIEKGRGKKQAIAMIATFCPFCGIHYAMPAAAIALATTAAEGVA